MQAAVMYGGVVVKGSVSSNSTSLAVCFSRAQKGRKQKQLSSSIDFSNTNCQLLSSSSSCMPHRTSCFGLRLDSFSMGTELTRSSLFRSRPIVKALASGSSGSFFFIYSWSCVFDFDLKTFRRRRSGRCGRR